MSLDKQYEDLIESLKQQRDELRVQMHLGHAEAKKEWDEIEKRWEKWFAEAKAQSKPLSEVIDQSSKDVGTAVENVLDELKKSYERIRGQLKS